MHSHRFATNASFHDSLSQEEQWRMHGKQHPKPEVLVYCPVLIEWADDRNVKHTYIAESEAIAEKFCPPHILSKKRTSYVQPTGSFDGMDQTPLH